MKMLLALLLSMSLITSCTLSEPVRQTGPLPAQTLRDVHFGKDSAQRMDLYLPAGRTANGTKVLVLIHGGGWNGGDKSEFNGYIDSFRKRLPGYAFININYRLVSAGHRFPAQESDVRAALKFLKERSAEFDIDMNRVSLLGASAGAHLALLQAYKYDEPRIRAVIDFFGPTDLVAMYRKPWHPLVPTALQYVTGTTPDQDMAVYTGASPLGMVSGKTPPTLILHGSNDGVVNLSQSRALEAALQEQGIPHELVVYKGERHGWYGAKLSASFDKAASFLEKHVP